MLSTLLRTTHAIITPLSLYLYIDLHAYTYTAKTTTTYGWQSQICTVASLPPTVASASPPYMNLQLITKEL